jgi:hypothetical protein
MQLELFGRGSSRRRRRKGYLRTSSIMGIVAAVLATVVALVSGHHSGCAETNSCPVTAQAAVVFTMLTAQDASYVPTQRDRNDWINIAENDGAIELVAVDGDGTVQETLVDLTPRVHGQVLQVPARIEQVAEANVDAFIARINRMVARKAGRSMFASLQYISRLPASLPVYLFSSGLDLDDPLNMRELAFDVDPQQIIKALRSHDELPQLAGRQIDWIMSPPAGSQAKPLQPQVDYLESLYQAIVSATQGELTIEFGAAAPAASTTQVPTVDIPSPTATIRPTRPAAGKPVTCTAPPAIFVAYQKTLVDPASAARQLSKCAAFARQGKFHLAFDCYVAEDADGITPDSIARGKRLALGRGQTLVGLLEHDLHVGPRYIGTPQGHGPDQPRVQPPTNPANRACVITFDPLSTGGK